MGHDVVGVSEVPELRGRSDEDILDLADAEQRAVVTHNFADFLALASDWAVAGRQHAGLVLVPISFQRRGASAYIAACDEVLRAYPAAQALRGQIVWTRSTG